MGALLSSSGAALLFLAVSVGAASTHPIAYPARQAAAFAHLPAAPSSSVHSRERSARTVSVLHAVRAPRAPPQKVEFAIEETDAAYESSGNVRDDVDDPPVSASDASLMRPSYASERLIKARELLQKAVQTSRAAEPLLQPSVPYDADAARKHFRNKPLVVSKRQVQLLSPLARFLGRVVMDIQMGVEKKNRRKRANELLQLISNLGPAIIKAGQALSSRPDLLPAEYLEELQKLQDRLPPFPSDIAFQTIEEELGMPINDVFSQIESEPIAAASIGQVYRARLRSNGAEVAVKVQRPGCEEIISLDLYILSTYSKIFTRLLGVLKRDLNLVSVIDDFGRLIYGEIDYLLEANNAKRFNELYAKTTPRVRAPLIYDEFTTRKVLVMEWIEGNRLTDKEVLDQRSVNRSELIDILVQCSFKQILDNGFFHADPHAGNLLVSPEGNLVYLDFGMMSYVKPYQRYSIIEAVVHLVNRDFEALANLYKRMGFIPPDQPTDPIVKALNATLPDVLGSSVSELNFKNVISKLGDVMYTYPFSLPPFYIAIIRCLGVLEGISIQVDPTFTIIKEAYPYIASLLLTDASEELQAALRNLSMPDGELRWSRLQSLLDNAVTDADFDVSLASTQLVNFLLSDEGEDVAEQVVPLLVDGLDDLTTETVDYVRSYSAYLRDLGGSFPRLPWVLAAPLASVLQPEGLARPPALNPTMNQMSHMVTMIRKGQAGDTRSLAMTLSKVLRNPRAQKLLNDFALGVSERAISRAFGYEPTASRRPTPPPPLIPTDIPSPPPPSLTAPPPSRRGVKQLKAATATQTVVPRGSVNGYEGATTQTMGRNRKRNGAGAGAARRTPQQQQQQQQQQPQRRERTYRPR